MKKIPMVGTLVGARSGVDGQFYRGLVSLPLNDTLAVITMIDYGNREELHCSQLFPLSQKLAEVQCLTALVRLSEVKDKPININAYQYLSKLVAKETQLQLTFQEPGDPVTLVETGSAISVNKKLKESMQGSWQSKIKMDEQMEELIHNYSIGKPTLGMLMSTILPLGRMSQFVVLQCLGQHEFVCCLSQDPLLRYVVKILTERMTQYVEECKDNRYVPSTEEICIAQWDDGLWYRAIAMCSSFVTTELTFLDFGDVKELPHTQIRRMPHDFNEAPALATYATLAGETDKSFKIRELLTCT
ncbi:hypothetical protein B566_EDAN008926 [Ephemera danica]|nr:hypothetical protein B566_EDAN008926 [Ephemera danica]